MGRPGVIVALLALLLVAVIAAKSESNSTNSPNPTASSSQSVTVETPENGANKTKEGMGQGYGGHRRRHEDYGEKKHNRRGGYHRDHNDDYNAFPYSKPYFDTHYCSVHGSFRLSYNEKKEYEKKEYEGGNGYQQEGAYGNSGGYHQEAGYGKEVGSYGKKSGGYERKERPQYVRKITRQYCRYAAAWSEKACKFCCKVVARSAYTNPDDIIAAIFSFDPSDPSSNGYGVESYGKQDDHSEEESYDKREEGYGSQGGYENQQQGYGAQQSYGGNSYGAPQQSYGAQPTYSQPPQYGNSPYRSKRNTGYSQAPAPAYGSAPPAQSYDQYQQPAEQYQQPAEQYQAPASDQYSATPDAYSTKPDNGNKYENSGNAISQCVCCAPKHRYY